MRPSDVLAVLGLVALIVALWFYGAHRGTSCQDRGGTWITTRWPSGACVEGRILR